MNIKILGLFMGLDPWVKDLNRHFMKDVQMANNHTERWLASLVIREMQIQWHYHFTPLECL